MIKSAEIVSQTHSRLANFIEQEKAVSPFMQLSGVKPLSDFLKLKDNQVREWEQVVRAKVRQMPAAMKG